MSLAYRIGLVVIVAWAGLGCEVLQDKREMRCECTTADDIRAFCEVAITDRDSTVAPP